RAGLGGRWAGRCGPGTGGYDSFASRAWRPAGGGGGGGGWGDPAERRAEDRARDLEREFVAPSDIQLRGIQQ
ncbi:hypothetical protein AB4144_59230, partial [Rhizobiaceae sp. 2RAB30]